MRDILLTGSLKHSTADMMGTAKSHLKSNAAVGSLGMFLRGSPFKPVYHSVKAVVTTAKNWKPFNVLQWVNGQTNCTISMPRNTTKG